MTKEAKEADEARSAERKKGFWGKRRVRRPTLKGGDKSPDPNSFNDHHSADSPIDGSTEGDHDSSKKDSKAAKAPLSEPKIPAVGEREEGDDYEDEKDHGPLDGPQHVDKSHHLPHLPHLATHYDKPLWVKESWEDLKVGDFVRLRGDESVPAGKSPYQIL